MRHSFSHSPLQRWLGDAGVVDDAWAGLDVAERMGQWLNVADAISLRTGLAAVAQSKRAGETPVGEDLSVQVTQLRARWAQDIQALAASTVPPPKRGSPPTRPQAAPPPPLEPATEFSLLNQSHSDVQRRMTWAVDALRSHAREVLRAHSDAMARLARMDELMAQVLDVRTHNALTTLPVWLKQRFEQRLAAKPEGDAAPTTERAWLDALIEDFQQALFAELDLRLQPIIGMAQALRAATTAPRGEHPAPVAPHGKQPNDDQ